MIFGNIHNLGDLNIYPEVLKEALNYLLETDLERLKSGTYKLKNDEIYVQVINLETDLVEKKLPEIHKNYLDIHFLAKGSERIGFSIDCDKNIIYKNYDENRDILFYQNCSSESFINMIPGNFVVFFPNDVHRPGCVGIKKEIIKKIVIKIHKNLLEEDKND